MAARVYLVEDGYAIRGAEPTGLRNRPDSVRLMYWGWLMEAALKAKDRDLSQGLDKDGRPLRRISAYTRKHRRSAMTPTGKGDSLAPPLTPGRQKSRVRSLLTGRAFPDHAEFWWRFDPFTHESFAKILEHQKEQGRDVFGLSPAALKRAVAQAWEKYDRWERGLRVEMPIVIRIAQAQPIQPVGKTGMANVTMGANAPRTLAGSSGLMRIEDRIKYLRQPVKMKIPGRRAGIFNRLLQLIWGKAG
jgi:hypothetical protein